jgi:hypothetical protein
MVRRSQMRKSLRREMASEPLPQALEARRRGRLRIGRGAVLLAAVGVALLVAGSGLAIRAVTQDGAAAPGTPSHPAAQGSGEGRQEARLQTAVRWIGGLSTGLLLPSDVSGRLRSQDAELGTVLMAAWAGLDPIRHQPARLQKAVRWITGLSSGLLLQSDVSGRLHQQDPEMAVIVTATWSELGALVKPTSDQIEWRLAPSG